MNYDFFELHVKNDDTSVIECNGPITSNIVTYKIIPSDGFKSDLSKIDNRSGIYVIRSISDEGAYKYYIGQTIDIKTRMHDHKNDDGVVYDYLYCTISDGRSDDLQAYLQCIETELIDRADKVKLLNKNTKEASKFRLPEYKQAIAEEYVDAFIAMANVMGYKELFSQQRKESAENPADGVRVTLQSAAGIRHADNTLTVLAGSKCRNNGNYNAESDNGNAKYDKQLWESLKENGYLSDDNTFIKNRVFDSPSQAARIVLGYSANGLDYWKTDEGLTLKQYLNRE